MFHSSHPARRIGILLLPLLLAVAGLPTALASPQLLSLRGPAFPPPAGGNGDSVAPRISADGRYILYSSSAGDLVPGDNGQLGLDVFLYDRTLNTTVLVSTNDLGTGGGNGSSDKARLSSTGRYVVFESDSSDLVPGDTNDASDIFFRDLVTGTTRLVSVATDGGFGNGASTDPVMTPDGTCVAFISSATNLVAGDTNGVRDDVFVRDLITQTTWLVSPGAVGGTMADPAITPDRRFVAFSSTATGLAAGVPFNTRGEVYVRDRLAGTTLWVSADANVLAQTLLGPSSLPYPSYHPSISDDGEYVTFKTGGTNRIDPVLILRYDTVSGTTTVISTNGVSTSAYSQDVYGPVMTPDGRFIAFARRESTTNYYAFSSIQLWDALTGSNVLVSCDTNGVVPPGTVSETPVISPDGRYVLFLSDAPGLVTNQVLAGFHVYLRDLQAEVTRLIDVDTNGAASADENRIVPDMTPDGSLIVFAGPDGKLVDFDSNKAYDVFARDMDADTTALISRRDSSITPVAGDAISSAGQYSLSADGRWEAFASHADDLVPNDTNDAEDVFVRDLQTGSNILVSAGTNGLPAAGGFSAQPAISADGRYVVFISTATNLVADHTNYYLNVFRRDLQSGLTELVSVGADGVSPANNDCFTPVISQDGRYVAFLSQANNLTAGFNGAGSCVFWRDMVSGTTEWVHALNSTAAAGGAPSMSSDGRYVAYAQPTITKMSVWDTQQSTNIYSNPNVVATNGSVSPDGTRLLYQYAGAIHVDDVLTGTNLFSFPSQASISASGQWSADGRYFAFVTAQAAAPGDNNGTNDVYLCDLLTHTLTLISVNRFGTGSGNGPCDSPVMSSDGRFVAYRSFATDLVPIGADNPPNIFIYDRTTGTNTLLSAPPSDSNWISWSLNPTIDSNGSTVGFDSWSSGFISGDVNRVQDVYAAAVDNSVPLDSDGDGIPDWWMIQYFGHPTGQAADQSLAGDDADGDGMSNLQEYLAGTNPTDPASYFRLQIADTAGGLMLQWTAMPGRTYQVEYKNSLNDPAWQALPGTAYVVGTQGSIGISSAGAEQYFRIALMN